MEKMEANPNDIKRAYAKLNQLLFRMKEVLEIENVNPARQNLRKAGEAFAAANVGEDPYSSVKQMDQALSCIHHAINDLLHDHPCPGSGDRVARGDGNSSYLRVGRGGN
jgi:hypothetical protein